MMKPRHKVYYTRIAASALTGLLSGLAGLTPMEGLSLFLLAYFLVTPLSLKLWGDELRDVGLLKLYREALGSSILALLLIWTLVINLAGSGVAIYVVRASQGGIYPIQTIEGRTVGPGERPLAGYNAVLLELEDGKIADIYVGTYAEKSPNTKLILGRTEVSLSESGDVTLRGSYNLSLERDLRRMGKLFGNVTMYRNGTVILNNSLRLEVGDLKEMDVGTGHIRVKHDPKGVLNLEIVSKMEALDELPLSAFISSIQEKEGYVYVFDAFKPVWKTKTARLDDSYVIVLPPG